MSLRLRRSSIGVPLALSVLVAPATSGAMILHDAPAPSARTTAAACAGHEPSGVRLRRLSGSRARLSWTAPAGFPGGAGPGGAGVVYRVLRSGRTVGQTSGQWLVVKVTPGRVTVFTVRMLRAGATGACAARLRLRVPFRLPGRVAGLRVLAPTATGVEIGWRSAARGDAPVVGYRVRRDGAVVGQTRGLSLALRLSASRSHLVSVAAVDSRGHVGPASAALVLAARSQPPAAPAPSRPAVSRPAQSRAATSAHAPPNAPGLLFATHVSDTSATLSWQAGSANEGATVAGYVLYQDGQPVGEISGQIATVTLASAREYMFTVRTKDSMGYLSEPAPELKVLTTHTPPPAPTGLTATAVTSQSATVSWSPSTAVSGTIVGYRVFRDEIPVGQTATPEMTLQNLAPSSEYQVTVSAVDSLGAVSEPTAPLTIHTAEPTPTHGDVQAFLLASTDQSFADLQAHYQQIGVLYPTYFSCGAEGEVLGKDEPLVTHWAVARKIEVLPRVNCQNPTEEENILNNPVDRERMINQLAEMCQTYGYQGVQIDFEGAPPSERGPFTAFITALAERLHAQGDKLSTTVTAKYYNIMSGRAAMYDDAALSGPSDYMFVLDWGIHWTTSKPGSIDEMAWFKRVAEYTATLPNRDKFVLGMPMYGIDWADGGGPANPGVALEFSGVMALVKELGVTPEWEETAVSPHFSYTDSGGVQHEVWYTDERSIGARAELARSLGLGVGLWRLGEEDQSVWELPVLDGSG
jgi:spore germination protein YaaH